MTHEEEKVIFDNSASRLSYDLMREKVLSVQEVVRKFLKHKEDHYGVDTPTQLLNIEKKKKKVNLSLSLIENVLGKIKKKDEDVDIKKLVRDLPRFRETLDLALPPATLEHAPPPVPAAVAPAPTPAPAPPGPIDEHRERTAAFFAKRYKKPAARKAPASPTRTSPRNHKRSKKGAIDLTQDD